MDHERRRMTRKIAGRHLVAGDALGWFEALYVAARGDPALISWADMCPNPNLVEWLDQWMGQNPVKKALKVGCGLGDDAEELARRGMVTTAFDISPTAITWCRRRFPLSSVRYVTANLFAPPADWFESFDFVLESYTLQVLPPRLRKEAIDRIGRFVAPGGRLLVISRGREVDEPAGDMPWPLIREELTVFSDVGLREIAFEDYMDNEEPPVRRLRVSYRKDT